MPLISWICMALPLYPPSASTITSLPLLSKSTSSGGRRSQEHGSYLFSTGISSSSTTYSPPSTGCHKQLKCSVIAIASSMVNHLLFFPWAAFSGLRTYALSRSRLLGILVFVLSIAPAVVKYMQFFIFDVRGVVDPIIGCHEHEFMSSSDQGRIRYRYQSHRHSVRGPCHIGDLAHDIQARDLQSTWLEPVQCLPLRRNDLLHSHTRSQYPQCQLLTRRRACCVDRAVRRPLRDGDVVPPV
ncbi:hypothetical protein L226DRAFT_340770 [Lentinus tigrinus ALCF2SS1-7]|uniref:uncharacterized protein n=1 Tax=Lentinus tigrinus ALCF2SS1-7 TaxID=1328758 RepID=UPI001165E322|nr:hypothetical protein L226DRAFT_340770 [Lentinus tigrinus ALCF2SS1-7]